MIGTRFGHYEITDGKFLFYSLSDKDGHRLWYRSLADLKETPTLFLDQAFCAIDASPSADGRFVAYSAESVPNASARWSRDGRLLSRREPTSCRSS